MAIRSDYGKREVEAAKRVLIELMQILGEYREQIVLVGGWVPYFLFGEDHTGSLDIDVALDRVSISEDVYRTIRENLELRGYRQGGKEFQFLKDVKLDDGPPITVQVDILAGEYGGTGKSHRHQKIQGNILAHKARGSDLALQYNTKVTVDGNMPDGSKNSVEVCISDVVPFIVMKSMVLRDRQKEKDAWDIYFCIKHFPGGVKKLSEEFLLVKENSLVQEGIKNIDSKFRSSDDFGPACVAVFEEVNDNDERDRIRRDAFEQVRALLDAIGLTPSGESKE